MNVLSESFIRQRLDTIETLISIYSDRDRIRLLALDIEKAQLELLLLDIMVSA